MDVREFIAECDELFQVYSIASPRNKDGYLEVYKRARKQISDPANVYAASSYLQQKLIILEYQKNFDRTPYIPVLNSIREAARVETPHIGKSADQTNWKVLLKEIISGRGELHFFEIKQNPILETALHTFARSYLRLKDLGVEFEEHNYEIGISPQSHDLINNEIDRLFRAYGGENFLKTLGANLGKTYNSVVGRFMEYRNLSTENSEILTALPFGYLFAIASKYSGTQGLGDAKFYTQAVNLITDLIVIFEIQPYGQYEAMFVEESDIISFIRKNILYDNFVGIHQTKSTFSSELIKHLNHNFSAVEYTSYGCSIKDLTRISAALISLSKTKQFTTTQAKTIASKTGISEFKVATVMDKLLSVRSGSVNSNLKFPPSSLEIDHYFKPSIKIEKNYKVFPKPIAAIGCLNTVLDSIARPDGKWSNQPDSKLGYVIEDFLRDAFRKKGIQVIHGNLLKSASDLEADLICETKTNIYIFEMKKKGLTRQAQSGDECQIFGDLADSVLVSHVQAMKIEKLLKTGKPLIFSHQNIDYSLQLNNRSVTRISVSLNDFGALQDKVVLQRILTIAATTNAKHPDKLKDERLKKWRKYSKELQHLAIENKELGSGGNPFHHSLFMSIPQIITVLEVSSDPIVFFANIQSFTYMTTGSRDTYTELLQRIKFLERSKL